MPDIEAAARLDGIKATRLVLDPALVAVQSRLMRPFRGWRCLPPVTLIVSCLPRYGASWSA